MQADPMASAMNLQWLMPYEEMDVAAAEMRESAFMNPLPENQAPLVALPEVPIEFMPAPLPADPPHAAFAPMPLPLPVNLPQLREYYSDMREAGLGLLVHKIHLMATLNEMLLSEGITQEWIEYAITQFCVLVLDCRNVLGLYETDDDDEMLTYTEHSSNQKEEFGQKLADFLQDVGPRFFSVVEDERTFYGVRVNRDGSEKLANLLGIYGGGRGGNDTATAILSARARRYRTPSVCVQVFTGADAFEIYCSCLRYGAAMATATAELTSTNTASSQLSKPRGDISAEGKMLKAMMTRKWDDMKQNRAGAELVAECMSLFEAGETIGTSVGGGADNLLTRLVFWTDKKSLRTNEDCAVFRDLCNITDEGELVESFLLC